MIVRVELADPPAVRATLVELQEVDGPLGNTDAAKVTGPANSPLLVNTILAVLEEPIVMLTYVGSVESVNALFNTVILATCVTQHDTSDLQDDD